MVCLPEQIAPPFQAKPQPSEGHDLGQIRQVTIPGPREGPDAYGLAMSDSFCLPFDIHFNLIKI